VQSGNVTLPPTRVYAVPLYVTLTPLTVAVAGPPVPGPAKVPLLDPELELDVVPELELDVDPELELLLEVDPLLELLLELLELTGVHVGSIPAGISMPLSIAM